MLPDGAVCGPTVHAMIGYMNLCSERYRLPQRMDAYLGLSAGFSL